MKSIKRTRGVSHKKKKVTAAVIKIENSRIKASLKASQYPSRKKPKTSSSVLPFTNQPPPTDDANDDTTNDDITNDDTNNDDAITEDAVVIDRLG